MRVVSHHTRCRVYRVCVLRVSIEYIEDFEYVVYCRVLSCVCRVCVVHRASTDGPHPVLSQDLLACADLLPCTCLLACAPVSSSTLVVSPVARSPTSAHVPSSNPSPYCDLRVPGVDWCPQN